MENRIINASLSTQNITFKSGGQPVAFEVTVVNGSNQFAAFQVEVIAAGASRTAGSKWYRLSPEVSAAKPPGGSTQFTVEIFDTPLPAFVGTVNLTVRIFSPQLGEERKLLVRLLIEPGLARTVLIVELPIRQLQVYPRNSVDIPVRVRNLSQQTVEAVLHFEGIASSWLNNSAERKLLLDPGSQVETTFQCQPPIAIQAPSQNYPFVAKVTSRDSSLTQAEGILEVLPIGFVEFTATPQKQTIPSDRKWLPDWKSNSAKFQLFFKNSSNLRQQVNVQLQEREKRKFTHTVSPENADAALGETTTVLLKVSTKRPWLGWGRTLWLEVKALLSDQRLGSTDPATQTVELKVLPIIPLWLQLALLALLTALLLYLLNFHEPIEHINFVSSVRFSSDALSSVVSGSDDCTIRLWSIDGDILKPPKETAKTPVTSACGKLVKSQGLLGVTDKAVSTLQFMPKEQDRIAAGLESGEIQLWNVRQRQREDILKDKTDTTNDRVFALVFTENSRKLFSGHGSGKVRVWSRPGPGSNFNQDPQVINLGKEKKYSIYSLAISNDEKFLATAGDFKRVMLFNRTTPQEGPKRLSLRTQSNGGNNDYDLKGGNNNYVFSIAFVPDSHKLATADSDGQIAIWDLDKCQDARDERQCDLLTQWDSKSALRQKSVRSIAFLDAKNLVSAGDDGRILVWPLTPDAKQDRAKSISGNLVYQDHFGIKSIAVTNNSQGPMIVSGGGGGNHFPVQLHRYQIKE